MSKQEDDDKLLAQARTRFEFICDKGSYLPGVSELINPDIPPDWYDEEKFKRSQKLAKKYFLSISMSSSVGLLLGIQIPIFLEPLLTTGNHRNIPKLYRRYLSTNLHVRNWYEEDPFEKSSRSYKSVRQVRTMHQKICKTMNEKTGKVIGVDKIWVSQTEMAFTQWAFFGLLILYPKECGAHDISQSDLEHFIYLWRVLGYLMGIEDRFNIGDGASFEENKALYRVILDDYMRPKLSQSPHPYQLGFDVSHGIAKALRPINQTIRFNVLLTYWYNILDISYDIPLSTVHRFRLASLKFTLNTSLKSRLLYALANYKQIKEIKSQEKKRHKVEKKLTQKYPNFVYESKCPFAVDLDYADVFDANCNKTDDAIDIVNKNKENSDNTNNNNAQKTNAVIDTDQNDNVTVP